MACNLVLRAQNGRQSMLFRDIAESSPTVNEAIDMYFYTKTDDFIEAYQGELDINDEPKYTEVAKGKYVYDVDYSKVELDSSAEIFKKLMSTIPEVIRQLESRIEYLKYKNDNTHVKNLQDLLDVLQTESVNESIPKFFESSTKHVDSLHNIAKKAFKEKINTKEELIKFGGLAKTAESYNIIRTLKNMLMDSSEVASLFEGSLNSLESTVDKIADIQSYYVTKSKEFLVDEIHRVDPTYTKKFIRQQLDYSPQDTTYINFLTGYLGDSSDFVLHTAAKFLVNNEHTIRRESIKFDKKLEEKLENLEAEHIGPATTMFDDIIIEHSNELHVIDTSVPANSTVEIHQKMYAKLQDIQNRPALVEYLNFYNENMRLLDIGLPKSSVMGSRVPSVMRSDIDLLKGGTLKEKRGRIADDVRNRIKASNLDMEKGQLVDVTGKPVKRIPTFYTQVYNSLDYKKAYKPLYDKYVKDGLSHDDANEKADLEAETIAKKALVKNNSRDLAGVLQSFHAMALNFSTKYESIHTYEAIEAIMGSEARMYGEVEGGKKVIDVKSGDQKVESNPNSVSYKFLMKVYDMQLYGMKQTDIGSVNMFGEDIDINKAIRLLTSATSFIQIPFNVTAAVANVNIAEYNNIMESIGGEYFTFKDYIKATKLYTKEFGNTLSDIGARTPKSFINLIEEHYSFLQNFGGEKITSTERKKILRLLKTDKAFFMNSSGEHFVQIRAALAMLNKVETFDKEGSSTGTLLDAHSEVKGELKIADGIYIKEKDGSLVKYTENQQNRIAMRTAAVLRKSHGNYSTKTAPTAKADARLNAVLQFRGWLAESVKKRFSKKSPNYALEQETEGFYVSGARALYGFANDLRKFNIDIAKSNWKNLTPHEKANIRRFAAESAMLTLTALASVMFGKIGKSIEEEYDSDDFQDRLALGAFRFTHYQVLRLKTEVGAYTSITEAFKLLRSPAATISLVESTADIVMQFAKPLEQYETGWRKGDYKIGVKLGKTLPIYKHLSVLTPQGIDEKTKWLN